MNSQSKISDSYNNTLSLAEQIREKRVILDSLNGTKITKDMYEQLGIEKVVYPQYTKFAVINTPTSSMKKEMTEVMQGYYDNKINKKDIKEFFMEYCEIKYARDEETILNIYESFLDKNYDSAVFACFDKSKDIAKGEGKTTDHLIYYDADYYYKSEEIHDLLKEVVKEYGAKYGLDIDATKRDENFKGKYLTGTPNFNDKWNYMAACVQGRGRLMDLTAVPPEGFSFFYQEGTDCGTKDNLLMISGNGWSKKVDVPFEMPAHKEITKYFYLSDLFQVSKEQEEHYDLYNNFMKQHIISRGLHSATITNY